MENFFRLLLACALIGIFWTGFIYVAPRFVGGVFEFLGGISENVVWACEIEKVEVRSELFVINGELDAGFVVDVLTRKTNRDGDVSVTVRLSSSEGELTKKRTLFLGKDKEMVIQFQFPEPTVNAQQIQAKADCITI